MYTGNPWVEYVMAQNVLFQIISNPTFTVDTFFFMSGFLLSYMFLKERRKYQGIPSIAKRMNEFFQMIVIRYIRYNIVSMLN